MNKDEKDQLDKCIHKGVVPIVGSIAKETGEMISYVMAQILLKDVKNICFMLSSSGGDGDLALEMYDAIRLFPCEKNVIVCGHAHSAAAVLLLAFDKRYATENSSFVVHHGKRDVKVLDLLDDERVATFVKRARLEEARFTKVFRNRTKMNDEEILMLNKADCPILVEEAIARGLIHDVWNKPLPWKIEEEKNQ
jgi:ATP-dependent protease ClpP protease subunit